jgi:hypothetical protein
MRQSISSRPCSRAVNPYGGLHRAEPIVAERKRSADPPELLQKRFHMLGD